MLDLMVVPGSNCRRDIADGRVQILKGGYGDGLLQRRESKALAAEKGRIIPVRATYELMVVIWESIAVRIEITI